WRLREMTHPPLLPMEARSVQQIPTGPEWQYEPKWDGFRCIAFRDGETVELQSKSGQPLTRYFPELAAAMLAVRAPHFILDAEIVIFRGDRLDFDELLQRIHPAASRVNKLAKETPARFVLFDLIAGDGGKSLLDKPLAKRRTALEKFFAKYLARN